MAQFEQLNGEILIVGPNWLGDGIMAMPAVQIFSGAFPGKKIVLLVKPKMAGLWKMHPVVAEVMTCAGSWPAMRKIAGQIRRRRFAEACILPQSFRSALIPFLAGIPRRRGLPGHFRRWLLTEAASLPQNAANLHQRHEYAAVLGCGMKEEERPVLRINRDQVEKAELILGRGKQPWIGMIPGAARGPAKRWPEDYFAALGKIIRENHYGNLAVFGSAAEKGLCARLTARIGNGSAINMAGRTSLADLAGLMSRCAVVIGNDSGGVHLAAAAGAAVIVIFGMTDPSKTKPLGHKVVVLQDSAVRGRDIPRRSAEAVESLERISPERVAEALRAMLGA